MTASNGKPRGKSCGSYRKNQAESTGRVPVEGIPVALRWIVSPPLQALRSTLAAMIVAAGVLSPSPARAVTVDWDVRTWTAGTLSNSYDVDVFAPGNDLTVALTGSTGELVNDSANNLPTPNINSNLEGGLNPVEKALNIAIDLGKKDRFVTITITFSGQYAQGVENVSFTLFGIDQAAAGSNLYIDEISSISATAIDGVSQIAPTITGVGSAVSHTGAGLNQFLTGGANVPSTGAGSGAGNATISFNATGIRSITFTFGAGGNSAVNPIFQDISLHDLTFSPVPEVNPAAIAISACLLVGAATATKRRRRSFRGRASG